MPLIKCINTHLKGGIAQECGGLLSEVGGSIEDFRTWLKMNPGVNMLTLRCHSCAPHQRFIRIYASNDGDIIWDASGEQRVAGETMLFDQTIRSEFVA